jgi:tetrapyrrole methylase family protein/MazG family protein
VDGIEGLQLFDAIELIQYHHPPVNPDFPLLLGQVYSRLLASDLKALLSRVYPEEHMVHLIHGAGNEDELVEQIALYEIDRSDAISHLTSLYLPPLPHLSTLAGLADTVAILRSPDGCPWDQEQTPQSMRGGFLEEACEVLTAIDEEDTAGIREELGDLLYHIVMQTEMASEEEAFRLTDVIAGIDAKLKRRHPHVWGDVSVAGSNEVVVNWEAIKQQEKPQKPASLFDNISPVLPALARSQKIQERARKVGFDWPEISGVYEKLAEEIAELQAAQSPKEQTAELGDLLFVAANLAKWLDVDAETALREANLKFIRRFEKVGQLAEERGVEISKLSLAELDRLWSEVKQHEN